METLKNASNVVYGRFCPPKEQDDLSDKFGTLSQEDQNLEKFLIPTYQIGITTNTGRYFAVNIDPNSNELKGIDIKNILFAHFSEHLTPTCYVDDMSLYCNGIKIPGHLYRKSYVEIRNNDLAKDYLRLSERQIYLEMIIRAY